MGPQFNDSVGGIINSIGEKMPVQTVAGKPCSNDYKMLSDEAKKNVKKRYYYEENLNYW